MVTHRPCGAAICTSASGVDLGALVAAKLQVSGPYTFSIILSDNFWAFFIEGIDNGSPQFLLEIFGYGMDKL